MRVEVRVRMQFHARPRVAGQLAEPLAGQIQQGRGTMTPVTATGDPPFRRELSRARSQLYGYLR